MRCSLALGQAPTTRPGIAGPSSWAGCALHAVPGDLRSTHLGMVPQPMEADECPSPNRCRSPRYAGCNASTAGVFATGAALAWCAVSADPHWAAGAGISETPQRPAQLASWALLGQPANLGEAVVGVPSYRKLNTVNAQSNGGI